MTAAKGRTEHSAALLMALIALAGLPAACSIAPNPDEHRFAQPWPFYLYLPDIYTPDRAWPLFIGVSGSSTDGRSCWNTWQRYADERGYVLLCPELADPDGQLEQVRANAKLLDILGRVYEEYSLQPKIFLVGFSAGGQFVHGYAFMNPNYVVGVSVIATGNYYQPPPSTGHILFVVIVGDRDDPGNVENAKQLARLLEQGGYSVKLHVLSGEGHTISEEAIQLTLALFDRTVGND
ncbi:MAG TPA: hypothetical protein VJK02_11280 [Anaerolineales bacterium]|nr:hypothetical protein [Anaerolineales bacterium]